MRWVWPLVMVLVLQGCFVGWNRKDQAKFAGFVALQGIDTWQSVGFIEDETEVNSLYRNKEALVLGKFISIGLVYGLGNLFPEARPVVLNLGCGLIGGTVLWNSTR